MNPLSLGFSPCPNDTFIFHALVHGLVDSGGLAFQPELADVEELNRRARSGALDVAKVSYGALPALLDDYVLLRSGGALGRGCGPLVVARETRDLSGARIAIPGEHTTAYLLLRLWNPTLPAPVPMVFSEIMPAVARSEVDAGLIIHESRFTYPEHGLVSLADLGEWWEGETGLPIPLGGIAARRALGDEVIHGVERAIRRSVEFAWGHPEASREYIARHAQEMDPAVRQAHIDLYVNEFSADLGDQGERAVGELFRRARSAGTVVPRTGSLFSRPEPAAR